MACRRLREEIDPLLDHGCLGPGHNGRLATIFQEPRNLQLELPCVIACMQRASVDVVDFRLHESSVADLRLRSWFIADPFAKDVVEFAIAENWVC